MKMKNLFFSASLIIALFSSCKKEDPDPIVVPTDKSITKELDLSADLFNWKYFSFTSGELVTVSDFQNDSTWDLGIHYESFRTNGGKSGIGQGSVIDLGAVDFSSVTISSILNETYVDDDSITVVTSMGAYGPTWEKVPGSVPMEDMFLSPQGPPPNPYTPNNHVYVIKTASGKHVKLIGTTFFDDLGTEGFFNFKYEFLD